MGGMEDPAALTQAITVTWVLSLHTGTVTSFCPRTTILLPDGVEVETHFHQCHKYEMGNYQVS